MLLWASYLCSALSSRFIYLFFPSFLSSLFWIFTTWYIYLVYFCFFSLHLVFLFRAWLLSRTIRCNTHQRSHTGMLTSQRGGTGWASHRLWGAFWKTKTTWSFRLCLSANSWKLLTKWLWPACQRWAHPCYGTYVPFFLFCWATTVSFQLNQLTRASEVFPSAPSWTSKAAKPLGYWGSWRICVVPVIAQHNVMCLYYCCLSGTT